MSYSRERFIELDRRFLPLSSDKAREEAALEGYSNLSPWMRARITLGWDDVLSRPLVVILGEAGSGKTWELMHRVAVAESKGQFAFFFALDRLINSTSLPFANAEQRKRFDIWKSTKATAEFLLDSVDEAKIGKTEDFYSALDRFREELGEEHMKRAHVVVSSRVTEWFPIADSVAVRERLPVPRTTQGQKEEFPLVLHILPLDEPAVRTYASTRWGEDGTRFVAALEHAFAWEFARRPADVDDLFDYWKKHGRLGTLTEILAFVTDQQLEKPSSDDRDDSLPLDRARTGAEHLAAATVLCRRFTFGIPGDDHQPLGSLSARQCLPADWQSSELQLLLNRAIFDGASHGCIRFHHRRVSEFLASRWLRRLMDAGCPIDALETLLTTSIRGTRILKQSTAPVAAWLCTGSNAWNREVFTWIMDSNPELLLRAGDPAELTLEQRLRLLDALKLRVKDRERQWWGDDRAALARLASPQLAEELNRLLRSSETPKDFRDLAMDIAAAGQLHDCREAMESVVLVELNSARGDFPKAFQSLSALDDKRSLRVVADAFNRHETHSPREFSCFALKALPAIWTVEDFVRELRKVPPNSRWMGWQESIRDLLCNVSETTSDGELLLTGLGTLATNAVASGDGDDPEIAELDDEDFAPSGLMFSLGVCEGMLGRSDLTLSEQRAIGHVLGKSREPRTRLAFSLDEKTWEQLIGDRPAVRRAFFEQAGRSVADRTEPHPSLGTIDIFFDTIKPSGKDLPWILEKLRDASSASEKTQACTWAIETWCGFSRDRRVQREIQSLVATDPELSKRAREVMQPSVRARFLGLWHRKIKRHFRRWIWKRRWQELTQWCSRWKASFRLRKHRDSLRSGKATHWLVELIRSNPSGGSSRWTPRDWSHVEKKWGQRVSDDARLGCKRMWRNFMPSLPSERAPGDSSVANGTIAGLAGIMAAWQDDELNFKNLTSEDAQRAVRYGFNEMNDFPDWFPELVSARPAEVRAVVMSELAKEIVASAEHQEVERTIQKVSWNGDITWPLMNEEILRLLREQDVKNPRALNHALRILCRTSHESIEELCSLCESKAKSTPTLDPTFPSWTALWVQLDAVTACDFLSERLDREPKAGSVMEHVCLLLENRDFHDTPIVSSPSWIQPEGFQKFVQLVYRWVRIKDDIHRQGSFTPGRRDHAQDFRNGLIERFVQLPDMRVAATLEDLRENPDFADVRSYIGNLIVRSNWAVAEGKPWKESDVRKFADEHELDPQSEYELFRLTMARLGNLKREVETGENSPRWTLRETDDEIGARRWFARHLESEARGKYHVPQESEISGRARIDLRVSRNGLQPIPIEVKVLDKGWTVPELLDSLELQLVGTYMRDHRAHYGVFLLVHFKSRTWRDEQGNILSIEAVMALLHAKRDEIVSRGNSVCGVEILTVDFSQPPPWRTLSK